MTAEELVSLIAEQLINPPGGHFNLGEHEFRNKVAFARTLSKFRICMILIAAETMRAKDNRRSVEWDGVIWHATKAFAEQWATIPGNSKADLAHAVQRTRTFLFTPNPDRQFERALWASFGNRDTKGEECPPPITLGAILPMLQEQYMALLDLCEGVRLVPRLGGGRPPPPNLRPPDA